MSRLPKHQEQNHLKAVDILTQEHLTLEDRVFVLNAWTPRYYGRPELKGAFFTPTGLAQSVAQEVPGGSNVLDLCAGIGSLAFWYQQEHPEASITCVERDPLYASVGRKVVPEAVWIEGDMFDESVWEAACSRRRTFDLCLTNPPFGFTTEHPGWMNYCGSLELMALEIGLRMADAVTAILPQSSLPFAYSNSGSPAHFYPFPRGEWTGKVKDFFAKNPHVHLSPHALNCGPFWGQWDGGASAVDLVMAWVEPGAEEFRAEVTLAAGKTGLALRTLKPLLDY